MGDHDKNKESSYLKILGCKQFIWFGNVAKTANKWF